jgi:hypothetical protein
MPPSTSFSSAFHLAFSDVLHAIDQQTCSNFAPEPRLQRARAFAWYLYWPLNYRVSRHIDSGASDSHCYSEDIESLDDPPGLTHHTQTAQPCLCKQQISIGSSSL